MDNKACLNWNEQENRYELHIEGKLMGHTVPLAGQQGTDEIHENGYDYLYKTAKRNGYTVHGGRYKLDAEKEGV